MIVAPNHRWADRWIRENRNPHRAVLVITSDTAKMGYRREDGDELVVLDPAVETLLMGGWIRVVRPAPRREGTRR